MSHKHNITRLCDIGRYMINRRKRTKNILRAMHVCRRRCRMKELRRRLLTAPVPDRIKNMLKIDKGHSGSSLIMPFRRYNFIANNAIEKI